MSKTEQEQTASLSPAEALEQETKELRSQVQTLKQQLLHERDTSETLRMHLEQLGDVRNAISRTRSEIDDKLLQLQSELDAREKNAAEVCRRRDSKLGRDAAKDRAHKKRGKPTTREDWMRFRKIFSFRDSTLTVMLRQESYATILNMVVASLVIQTIHTILGDFIESGDLGYALVNWTLLVTCFRNLLPGLMRWMGMVAASMLVIPLAHVAASKRSIRRESAGSRFWWTAACFMYVGLQVGLYWYAASAVVYNQSDFGAGTKVMILCEQTRLSLKVHSYFREKVWYDMGVINGAGPPSALLSVPFNDGLNYVRREFGLYFSFLWFPTLIYRESYPRTSSIRLSFVVKQVAVILGTMYYLYVIFRATLPQFERTVADPGDWVTFVNSAFACMVPGMSLLLLMHFLVLHAVQNLGAELTRFADREFYRDWWNSRDWGTYYRRWNGVVHDWIHNYIYLDLQQFCGLSRTVALFTSFAVSAVIHEWIIMLSCGFFFPLLLFLFGGPGVFFTFLTRGGRSGVWNVFMWLMLAIGTSLLFIMYSREWYSQIMLIHPETDVHDGRWYTFFLPRSFLPLVNSAQQPFYPFVRMVNNEL